ncbi:MAG: hypothetical protein ACTSP6_03740 [Promethearchaeota archaeon]
MYDYIKKYEFKDNPKEITYFDGEPLKLSKEFTEFTFYHNKNWFRKELNRFQYLFKTHLKNPLLASGIRDTYLKEEYAENYLILLFTDGLTVKNTNHIIEANLDKEFSQGCFYIVSDTKYLLLIAKEKKGLISSLNVMEEILTQTLEDYFNQQQFDDFIKIRPFKLFNCTNPE